MFHTTFNIQSTLPKSNPMGLKKQLRLREYSTYDLMGSKTIEIKKRGLEIDLRLRRLFDLYEFNLGRVDGTMQLTYNFNQPYLFSLLSYMNIACGLAA